MKYKALLKVLSNLVPLSPEFEKAIVKLIAPISLPKHYMLIDAPKVADHAYFLETGFAVSFYYSKGKKMVDSFWKAGDFIFLPKSLFEQAPSNVHIQLSEDSDLQCISFKNIQILCNRFPEANGIYRILITQVIEGYRNKIRDLQTLRSAERFKKIVQEYPDIEQVVTQEILASYLAITPQSLSRLKRSKSKT